MNTSGQRVSDALDGLEADFASDGIRETRDADVDTFLAQGHAIRKGLEGVAHGDLHPADFDRQEMREWLRHAWTTQSEVQAIRVGMAEGETAKQALGAITAGRWIRQSGLSEEEATRELVRRAQAGEPMPWEQ